MLKQKARVFSMGLLAVELGLWTASFFGAYALRGAYGPLAPIPAYLPLLGVVLATWVVFSGAAGPQFQSRRTRPIGEELWTLALGGVLVAGAMAATVFLTHQADQTSRLVVGLFAAGGLGAVVANRVAVRWSLRRARARGLNTRRLAIVGDGPVPARLAATVADHREWGLHLAGYVSVAPDGPRPEPHLGDIADIADILERTVIDEVIFAATDLDLGRFERALAACEEAGVNTRIVLDFFPHKFSRLALEDLDGVPTLAFHATSNAELALLVKRGVDLLVAAAVLVVGAPVFAAIAVAIRASGPGPIVFVQRRVGLQGREFDMYKFRSMAADAEQRLPDLAARNERSGPAFKIRDDPRVTRLGRFLRRTSLDEIPQFLNVLRGEMSVVGPRPPLPAEVARYERWQRRRLSVKPGLTCIWQVSGRGANVDFDTWMRLDLHYIDNWSLWLDLKLFVLTIPVLLLGREA